MQTNEASFEPASLSLRVWNLVVGVSAAVRVAATAAVVGIASSALWWGEGVGLRGLLEVMRRRWGLARLRSGA